MNSFILFVILIIVLSAVFNQPDDTDKSYFQRSGMYLYTDYKTGLQYISAPGGIFGGRGQLIPRVDANGKQIRIEIK